jgi:hypothetical protein
MQTVITFDDIRDLALALPEVDLGTFGRGGSSTTFEVRGKGFARFGGHVNGLDDETAAETLVIRITPEQREALLSTFPDKFFITPHYLGGGAVLTRLSLLRPDDMDELKDLLTDAWRRFAPKRLVRAFDETDVS